MYDSKTVGRPRSPVKTLWFEFLLNPNLLEIHLSYPNSDPSATDLIIKFLVNCTGYSSESSSASINGTQSCNNQQSPYAVLPPEENETEISQIKTSKDVKKSKKAEALKLLALKVAAFLKWDLNTIEKKLPLTMQQLLLTEFLKITDADVEGNNVKCFRDLSPDAQFARILYYIWVLRAVIEGNYPTKSQKGLNVQIPGQVDSSVAPPVAVELILKKLHDETEQACLTLEEVLESNFRVRMPLLSCFGSVTEECLEPNHKWDLGLELNRDDILCQILYDLGRFYFFFEKYDKASKHFIKASDIYPRLSNSNFCNLNPSKLKGFFGACAHLLGYQHTDASTSLKEALQVSVKENQIHTVSILKRDNISKELPIALRDAVEINIIQDYSSNMELFLYVTFLNALRRTLDGKVVLSDWCSVLKAYEEKSSLILCELLKGTIPMASAQEKIYLKNFVRMICLSSVAAKVLFKKFDVLGSLLSPTEVEELLNFGQQISKRSNLKLDKSFTDNSLIQAGLLERHLLATGDAGSVKFLVSELRRRYNIQSVASLNKNWELNRTVSIFLKNVPPHIDQEMIQILLAKSNELRAIKKYSEASMLCSVISKEIGNFSLRLTRYLNWELLQLDLLTVLDIPVYICQISSYRADIVQRIYTFLNSPKEREKIADSYLQELCAAVLLNFREWDKLYDIDTKSDPYFEFAKVLSGVCRDVFLNKGNRNTSRDLWELILPIFNNPLQNHHKRTSSGLIKDSPREVSQAIMNKVALQQFIKKLKETSSLCIIISCLAKLYNILKDDSIGEIFLEYTGLWPSVVPNCASYNMSAVGEVFQATLQHALSIHPTHSSWLRTKGDVMYVQGHYSSALKFYLSAAVISTDYFYQQLPKILFDDLMFKHMIHCCTKLQNYSQSAVLHQFLEESNYPVAFKALAERICNDSCDTYYPCIWDVTMLEFLINHHSRRGELDCRQLVLQLVGQLELNSNNNEEIQREAASLRKGRFLRSMASQFL